MGGQCELIPFGAKKRIRRCNKENDNNVVKLPKYKKDGTIKETVSNSERERDNKEPFKIDDVDKMIDYFMNKVDDTTKNGTEYQIFLAYRNLAFFVMGINVGIRAGDLLNLTWDKLYDDNWNMLSHAKITPQKTSKKNKKVVLAYNSAFTIIAEQYRKLCEPRKVTDFIFSHSLEDNKPIEYRMALHIIQDAAEAVGITYPIGTHSMRKTFGRQRYEKSSDKSRTLVELMQLFRHEDPTTTLAYIGITLEEQIDLYNEVNLGLEKLQGYFTNKNGKLM